MGYQWGLCTQWSRRDRLTVVIIAVATAFLVGTTLLLVAASTQTASISAGYSHSMEATYHESYSDAKAAAGSDDIVFPVATARRNGTTQYVVGVPSDAPTVLENLSVSWRTARIPPPTGNATLKGPVSGRTQQKFVGTESTRTVAVAPYPENDSIFPQTWYVGDPTTVRSLGVSGGYVIDTTPDESADEAVGTASPALYRYFVAGMEEVLHLLGLAAIGGSVLVLVVVYNVTRMSVRDRLQAIEVIRSTGGTPRQLLAIFGVRAGLLTATGIALGYALGVIVTRAVVNAAIAAGLHISLDPTVTPRVLRIILPSFAALLLVGVVAGVLAVRPATTTPPSRIRQEYSPVSNQTGITNPPETANRGWISNLTTAVANTRVREFVDTTLLRWRAFVPATTILTIFVLIVVLVGSLVGTLAPLATTSGGTVTEPGASYPMASRIDAGYADLLRNQGVTASPEIIVVQVRDGQPYLARGANYSAFAAVSNARLTAGRAPQTKHEAVIGRDLARTLDITVGDRLTLGGATSPAITQVTIVGTFAADGVGDDQLVVPLATAHDLSTRSGVVHFIRTDDASAQLDRAAGSKANGIVVSGVSASGSAVRGQPLSVRISVRNLGKAERTRRLTASVGKTSKSRSVTLAPGERRDVTVNLTTTELGNQTLRVGSYSQSITVYRRPPLSVPTLPSTAPPNATMAVPVRTTDGENVSAATVRLGEQTARTNQDGIAMVRLPNREGIYNLTVQKGERTNTSQIRVSSEAVRRPISTVDVSPNNASVFTRPTATVTLFNQWNRRITREVSFVTPTKTETRTVTLAPYETVQTTTELGTESAGQTSPGEYSVRIVTNGKTLAKDTYTVHGDDRLFSTLAQNTQYERGTGLGQAVQGVFGNFNLLLLVMVVLAGLTAIGGTTATFAQSVHARRRALGVYRATGATRWQLLRTLVADAVRISVPAIVVALVAVLATIRLLSWVGLFTVFGFRLSTRVPPRILFIAVGSALVLMCCSVFIAALPYLTASPTTVQRGGSERPTTTDRPEIDHQEDTVRWRRSRGNPSKSGDD
ncbi:FtsX-like permease family protein [Haladaptatus sp. DFWS20]|uniref:ABC transporter permease n=1 Tax=Haladaptatus sp. DFWS20 TaxID=3403467 RepID=UPI003EBB2D3A